MFLSDTCIKRPVLATVLSLIIVLIGVCSYFYLDIRYFPKFESKTISVTTAFSGASASLVETDITNILESAISSVPDIKYMSSTSSRGSSSISVKLKSSANVNETANLIRNKVSASQANLPAGVNPPTVQIGHDTDNFMYLTFSDAKMKPLEIRDYLQRYVVNGLVAVPGMAAANMKGANGYALRINLDPDKMAASQITVDDVQNAIQSTNLEMPAGRIKSDEMDYPVTANTQLKSIDAFGKLVVKNVGNKMVHLNDIADLKLGDDGDAIRLMVVDGKPAVGVELYAQADANPIRVARAVRHKLKLIKANLPDGMQVHVFFDNTRFLSQSVHEVYLSIFFAIICVLIAVFLFLGSPRAVAIPITTIPVCVISAYAVMLLCGFSINVITLLALVLSIGLVVDDAIVMLENIHRNIEMGLAPMEAAFKGSKQIAFAVIGMTVSLAAVYAPVGFASGHIAIIFREFAFTLAGAVLISGFVALTLSPMMCSRLLSADLLKTGYTHWLEGFFERLHARYHALLTGALRIRHIIILITCALAVFGVFVFKSLSQQFMPPSDLGLIISVINTPTGANFNFIKKQADLVEKTVSQNKAIKRSMYDINDSARYFNHVRSVLKPSGSHEKSAPEVAKELTNTLDQIPGLDAFVFAPSPFSGGDHQDFNFVLMTSGTYKSLYGTVDKVKKFLEKYPGLNNINDDMNYDSQEYEIEVNVDLASALGVSVQTVDSAISAMLGGLNVTYLNMNDYRYNVTLMAAPKYLHSINNFDKFYVTNADGKQIPLSNLVSIKSVLGQSSLPHYNHLRSADIYGQLSEGYTLGDVVNYINDNLRAQLPTDTKFAYKGMAEKLQDSNNSMLFIFVLAVILIYLVLAALFESFVDPLIVLLSVPLCIVGALACLKLYGGTLNVYTDIALITLVGLISKHGILITQFTNELVAAGKPLKEAIYEGAAIRLRPILMTTAAMVFGALPLLFAGGAGAESRRQIGIVIISGLLFGTFFSLFVVPVTYSYLAKLKPKPKQAKS
jgi:multidrug efflux pump